MKPRVIPVKDCAQFAPALSRVIIRLPSLRKGDRP
jgi:hypothetical protein